MSPSQLTIRIGIINLRPWIAAMAACVALSADQKLVAQGDDWGTVARQVHATLKSRVQLRGLRITLADIADLEGLDDRRVRAAGRIDLGAAPRAGQVIFLKRITIERMIAARRRHQVTLKGSASIQVKPETVQLSPSEVATLARRWLYKELKAGGHSAGIRPSARPQPLLANAGRWSTRFEVRPPKRSLLLGGLITAQVVAVVDGQDAAAVNVPLLLIKDIEVMVLKRRVAAGRDIRPNDWHTERRRSDPAFADIVEDPSELGSVIAARALPIGTVLTRKDVKERPVLGRNALVTVRITSGALTITGSGTVMESGAPGDVVRVRTGKNRRIVRAKVVDSKTVEVVDQTTGAK